MSLLEDIYLEDEADEANDLERIIEGGIEDIALDEEDDDAEPRDDEAEEEKQRVDPTKPKSVRVVKNPRIVLNPARLTGPRGIQAINESFKDFKFKGVPYIWQETAVPFVYNNTEPFIEECWDEDDSPQPASSGVPYIWQETAVPFVYNNTEPFIEECWDEDDSPQPASSGKGHEKEDLDVILKKLEHWAHRLYPKFQFDDCLKKIEQLGKKRPVKVHITKIRRDMLNDENDIVNQKDSSDEENERTRETNEEQDQFDVLLEEQIAKARATPAAKTPAHTSTPKPGTSSSLTEEQKQRMLRNRQLAEEKRLARMRQNTADNISHSNKPSEVVNDCFENDKETEFDGLARNNPETVDLSDIDENDSGVCNVPTPNRLGVVDKVLKNYKDAEFDDLARKNSRTVDLSDSDENDIGFHNEQKAFDTVDLTKPDRNIEVDLTNDLNLQNKQIPNTENIDLTENCEEMEVDKDMRAAWVHSDSEDETSNSVHADSNEKLESQKKESEMTTIGEATLNFEAEMNVVEQNDSNEPEKIDNQPENNNKIQNIESMEVENINSDLANNQKAAENVENISEEDFNDGFEII